MKTRKFNTVVVGLTTLLSASLGFAESLVVTAISSSGCASGDFVAQGQQVRLTGEGFSPGSTVEISFKCCGQPVTFAPTTASGTGAINTVVTLPTVTNGWPVYPVDVLLMARNTAKPVELITAGLVMGPPGPVVDSDQDGRPNFCDNCKDTPNSIQDDQDLDGLGNSCDACPGDATNDADNDGLCEGGLTQCPNDPQNDQDADGICGNVDNCRGIFNPGQDDSDGNGIGDACQQLATCSDGQDNDGDGRTDFPTDPGCTSTSDTAETEASLICDDGKDNDSDGKIDFRRKPGTGDPGCGLWWGAAVAEKTECDDGIDNNNDGKYDWDGWNGEFERDPNCSVFGFGTSESVPEPVASYQVGALVGFAAVLAIKRHRRKGRVSRRAH